MANGLKRPIMCVCVAVAMATTRRAAGLEPKQLVRARKLSIHSEDIESRMYLESASEIDITSILTGKFLVIQFLVAQSKYQEQQRPWI